jgi:choline monooxygenase
VNVDAHAPPLASFLDDLPARVAGFGVDAMTHVMRRDYVIECNWKIYVDNYLEGYHIPVVHPGLFKEIDYDRYRVETRRYSSHQHAPLRPARGAGGAGGTAASSEQQPRRYVAEGDDAQAQAHYFWLFPNVMLNIYLGQMQTNVIVPLAHDRTLTVFEWYTAHPPSTAEEKARWDDLSTFSDEIQAEDIAICEAVQKNLRSRAYERGRYSVKRENGLHHFHGLLYEFLSTPERA